MRLLVAATLLAASIVSAQEKDPLADVGAVLRSGKPAEARQGIARALEEARANDDAHREALCLLLLGTIDTRLGEPASARANLMQSVERFESLRDPFGSSMAFLALGELEKRETRYDEAIVAYERALAVLAKAAQPDQSFTAEHLQGLAKFLGLQRLMPLVALAPPEMLESIFLTVMEPPTRSRYASALIAAGRLKDAEAELAKARQSPMMMFGGLLDASLAAHTADLRRRQGRFDEARAEYKNALEGELFLPMFAGDARRERIGILNRLADLEILSGRADDALAWNDRALALVRAAEDRRDEAWLLQERGFLLFRATRYDAAQAAYEEALKVAAAANDARRRAEILSDLAGLNYARGRYGTAASQFEAAAQIFREQKKGTDEAYARMMLANIYDILALPENAKLAMENAENLAAASDFRATKIIVHLTSVVHRYGAGEATIEELTDALRWMWSSPEAQSMLWSQYGADAMLQFICDPMATTAGAPTRAMPEMTPFATGLHWLLKGRALLERGELAAARAALLEGLELNPTRELTPAFLVLLGTAWKKEGKLEEATEAFIEAAETFEMNVEDIRIEEMMASYVGTGRNVYYDVLIEALASQGRVAEAFDFTERARARAFLRLIGNTRIRARDDREAEALRARIADAERGDRLDEELGKVRARYAALLTQIKMSNSEYASVTTVKPLTIEQLRGELPADTTLISYFVTQWGVRAWLLDRTTLHQVKLPAAAAEVAKAKCWAEHLGHLRGAERASDCARASAEDAYRALFAPLRDRVRNRRLMIVAHGPLHYVPFAALRDPETRRYLIEDYTISYAPSASALRFLREKETPVDGAALVFGEPAGAGLPHAEREATRVAGALGTTALLGTEAMESRLYRLAGKVDLIHIAAHGTYDDKHPLFSRVALARGEGSDGSLDVHEILGELDLTGVNLVVLAACESGIGKRSSGDDVVGLTRALLYAGSPGVVATLWRIGDEAAAVLMDDFYRRLLAGDSAADALRFAQLAMLRGDDFPEPGHWAAFGVYGNPLGRWGGRTRSPQAGQ